MDQLLYNCLPRIDDLIDLSTDGFPAPPDFQKNGSSFILLAGLSEEEVLELMTAASRRGDELCARLSAQSPDTGWDVSAKPVLLFESLGSALELHRLACTENEDEVLDLAHRLQLEFNEPWGRVKSISDEVWRGIYRHFCGE